MHRRWLLFPLTLSLAVLIGCDLEEFGDSQRFQDDFHHTYALKPGGRLYVENFNGSLDISGWDQDTVDISGTKYASTEGMLNALRVDIVASSDSVRIRTVRPFERHGNMGAKYVIRVPRRTTLDRIQSSNGSIRVLDIDAQARLETSNGSVEVTNSSGPVTVRTSNGSVRASGVRGGFDATTSNGGIRVALEKVLERRPVRLSTSNGGVELSASDLQNNDVTASTSNGSITVRLPNSVSAEVRANTSNSSITNEFGDSFKGRSGKTYLDGTIGSGGPLLSLSTSNGSIKLLRW
jgi:DUF4097 and DUF4098 domain-containing protein YvlB